MMSHSLCLSKHQLVKYIPTFAKATLKWATSWSTENQSSSKSQVPIWKSEQIQVANYFKNTQNIFMSLLDAPLRWCAAWIFKSEIQIWTSKPWSQTWDTQTECLKKSLGRCRCGHCVTEHSKGCNWMSPKYLQSLCSCKGEPGHKRKSEFKRNFCNGCWEIQQLLEATIYFWNTFPNLPQPWFCHNPTNHMGSIYQQPTEILRSTLPGPHLVLLHRALGKLLHTYYS